jgi:hypothetical protein
MSLPVDRPYAVDYTYRDIESKIGFKWGAANNPVPQALRIEVKLPSGQVDNIREHAEYTSFDDAVEEGKLHVNRYVDRFLAAQG